MKITQWEQAVINAKTFAEDCKEKIKKETGKDVDNFWYNSEFDIWRIIYKDGTKETFLADKFDFKYK